MVTMKLLSEQYNIENHCWVVNLTLYYNINMIDNGRVPYTKCLLVSHYNCPPHPNNEYKIPALYKNKPKNIQYNMTKIHKQALHILSYLPK